MLTGLLRGGTYSHHNLSLMQLMLLCCIGAALGQDDSRFTLRPFASCMKRVVISARCKYLQLYRTACLCMLPWSS